MGRGRVELLDLLFGEAVLAPAMRRDQRAVHDKVGVAADRRGEMRVVAQGEAEMAEILRAVIGLRHGAERGEVDELALVASRGLVQQAVEMRGLEHLALGEGEARGVGSVAQGFELVLRRLLVNAEEQGRLLLDQLLRRRDVGEDHELLDQPVRVEPFGEVDAFHDAILAEADAPFGQVEVERLAALARRLERGIGGIERLDHLLDEGRGLLVRVSVLGRLRLLVGQRGGGAHQAAHEAWPTSFRRRRR